MPRRMVAPDGTEIQVADKDMPAAAALEQAGKLAAYGSPQHMAWLGVTGPDAIKRTPLANMSEIPTVPGDLSGAGDVAYGAGKGGASSAAGMLRLLSKGVKAATGKDPYSADEYAADESRLDPTNTMQSIGKGGEQVAELLAPIGDASLVGKAVRIGTKQGRTARGAFTVGKPVMKDLIRRALLKSSVQGAETGLISEAQQEGSGLTGMVTGIAGQGAAEAGKIAEPVIARTLNTPMARQIILHTLPSMLTLGAGLGATGHISGRHAAEGAAALAIMHPAGRAMVRGLLRAAPGALPFVPTKMRVNDPTVSNIADSEEHINKGN